MSDETRDDSENTLREEDSEDIEMGLRALFKESKRESKSISLSDFRVDSRDDRAAKDAADKVASRLGRYEVLGEIARGGVGAVLAARDEDLGREVAIKVLLDSHESNDALRRRLIEEAQIGGQLEHPGICTVHELGVDDRKQPFLAMELVRGRTLSELLEERASPDEDRQRFLGILARIAQAVAYAHDRGVVHRDLKPLNVMIGSFGEVLVMDWGLAKVLQRDGDLENTRSGSEEGARPDKSDEIRTYRSHGADASLLGSVMGTPAYMSPEQAAGLNDAIDERCDVFSLGAMLCEILTGSPIYRGKTVSEVLTQAREANLSSAFEDLESCGADAEVISIAREALATTPEERPRHAGILAERLTVFLDSLEERARSAELEGAEARARAVGERKARRLTVLLASTLVLATLIVVFVLEAVSRSRLERVGRLERELTEALETASSLSGRAESSGWLDLAPWEAAAEAGQRARAAATMEVDASLRERAVRVAEGLDHQLSGVRLLHRLEQTRQSLTSTLDEMADLDRRYASTLDGFVQLDALEESAKRIRATGFAEPIARYLDDWSRLCLDQVGERSERFVALIELARLIDPHSWRDQLRIAFRDHDLNGLRNLAEQSDVDGDSASALDLDLLATALLAAGDRDLSERVWKRAERMDPTEFWVHFGLAIHARTRTRVRPDEVIRYLSTARALRPDNVSITRDLARALAVRGDVDEAIAMLEFLVVSQPDNPLAAETLALVLGEGTGDLSAAERSARKAVAMYEKNGAAPHRLAASLDALAKVVERRGRSTEAISLLERAVDIAPRNAARLASLGLALKKSGQTQEAIARLRESIEIEPSAQSWHAIGGAYGALGALPDAAKAHREGVELTPRDVRGRLLLASTLRRLGDELGALEQSVIAVEIAPREIAARDSVVEDLVHQTLDRASIEDARDRLFRQQGREGNIRLALLAAWTRAPISKGGAEMVAMARDTVLESPDDPLRQLFLSKALVAMGRFQEALRVAKRVVAKAPPSAKGPWPAYRVEPLVVEAAARSSAARGGGGPTLAERSARLDQIVQTLEGSSRSAAAQHYEGRMLALAGDVDGAMAAYLAALESSPGVEEVWIAFAQSLVAKHDPETAVARVSEELARLERSDGFRQRVLAVPALNQAPKEREAMEHVSREDIKNRSPKSNALVDPDAVTLRTSPFSGAAAVNHSFTIWELREDGGRYELDPTFALATAEYLDSCDLPRGLLLPGRRYRWRAIHVGEDRVPRGPSIETLFETRAGDFRIERLDLSSIFDRDVVADSGDTTHDGFDIDGALLLVDGYDLASKEAAHVRGLPADREFSVYRLGDYADKNAHWLAPGGSPVDLPLPKGKYKALRFLVSGGNGRSRVPLKIDYADGKSERAPVACEDWFEDLPPIGQVASGAVPIRNGMDRILDGKFDDANDAALFEFVVPCDPSRQIDAISLHPKEGRFESARTRFVLFAVTGVRTP